MTRIYIKENTHNRHVGQRNVLWTPPNTYGEVGFEAWLIETWECHPSTRGLKVSWSQGSAKRHQQLSGSWNMWPSKYVLIFHQTCCKKSLKILPGLSCAGPVCALIEAREAFCKFCPKLNIQKVLLPTAEHPGRKNTNLLMGRVVKNWKNLWREKQDIVKSFISSQFISCSVFSATWSDRRPRSWFNMVAFVMSRPLLCNTIQFVLFWTSISICTEPVKLRLVRLGCSRRR